ncbi:hypothetical protein PX701_09395 [Agromyces sp. H3Y2-19a]|uniref:hypothetical protein n=1 Tax=Agromyces chromiiresistens TaxID=3030835 RepID=UPI0023B8B40A|nr:hypothetical protein [Agromyces chromiiresistens]MDF0513833.1 hypothetical protein [Agromyces chromiiresistens]
MIVVAVPIAVTAIHSSSYPADVSEDDLVGVWSAAVSDRRMVLAADGTAEMSGSGGAEWSWRLDRHSVHLRWQDAVEPAAEIELDAVTCGFDICLRYYGADEALTMFRRR